MPWFVFGPRGATPWGLAYFDARGRPARALWQRHVSSPPPAMYVRSVGMSFFLSFLSISFALCPFWSAPSRLAPGNASCSSARRERCSILSVPPRAGSHLFRARPPAPPQQEHSLRFWPAVTLCGGLPFFPSLPQRTTHCAPLLDWQSAAADFRGPASPATLLPATSRRLLAVFFCSPSAPIFAPRCPALPWRFWCNRKSSQSSASPSPLSSGARREGATWASLFITAHQAPLRRACSVFPLLAWRLPFPN